MDDNDFVDVTPIVDPSIAPISSPVPQIKKNEEEPILKKEKSGLMTSIKENKILVMIVVIVIIIIIIFAYVVYKKPKQKDVSVKSRNPDHHRYPEVKQHFSSKFQISETKKLDPESSQKLENAYVSDVKKQQIQENQIQPLFREEDNKSDSEKIDIDKSDLKNLVRVRNFDDEDEKNPKDVSTMSNIKKFESIENGISNIDNCESDDYESDDSINEFVNSYNVEE